MPQCRGQTLKHDRCKKRTQTDGKCYIHGEREDGLRVKPSTIPGAGKGLFAAKKGPRVKAGGEVFHQGDRIDWYAGKVLTGKKMDKRYGPDDIAEYVLQVGKDRFVDAKKPTSCYARWANSARGPRVNARLAKSTKHKSRGQLIATKSIRKDQEILTTYGRGPGLGYEKAN